MRRHLLASLLVATLVAGVADAHHSPEHVIAAIEQDLAAGRESARLHVRRGDELRALGRLRDAVDGYQAALRLEPDSLPAQLGLSKSLVELGDHDAATAAAERGASLASSDASRAPFHAVRAAVAEAEEDDKAALVAWREAIRSPAPEVDWLLAHAAAAGRVEGAEAKRVALEAAVGRCPSVVLERELLAARIECGDVADALAEIEAGLERSRWKSTWLLLRARANAAAGATSSARDDAAAARLELLGRLESAPRNPAIGRQLAEAERVAAQIERDLP